MKTDTLYPEEIAFCALADDYFASSVVTWRACDSPSPRPLIAGSHPILARRMAEIGENEDDYDHPHDAIIALHSACSEMPEPAFFARAGLHARLLLAVLLHAKTTNILSGDARDGACAAFAASALDLFHDACEMDRVLVLAEVVLMCSPHLDVHLGDTSARSALRVMLRSRMQAAADAANQLRNPDSALRFIDAVDRAIARDPTGNPSSALERVRSKALMLRGLGVDALAAAEKAVRFATTNEDRLLATTNLKELRHEALGEPLDYVAIAAEVFTRAVEGGKSVSAMVEAFNRGNVVPSVDFEATTSSIQSVMAAAVDAGFDVQKTLLFQVKQAFSEGRPERVEALWPALSDLALSEGKDGVDAALLLALSDRAAAPEALAAAIDRATRELRGTEPLEISRSVALCFAQLPSNRARALAWGSMLRFQEHLVRSFEGSLGAGTLEQRMDHLRLLFPDLELSCFMLISLAEVATSSDDELLLFRLLHRLFSLFSGFALRVERTWRSLADKGSVEGIRDQLAALSRAIGAGDTGAIQRLREDIYARLVSVRRILEPIARGGDQDDFTFPQIVLTRTASIVHRAESEESQTVFLLDNLKGRPRLIQTRLDERSLSSLASIADRDRRMLDDAMLTRLSEDIIPYSSGDLPACFGVRLGGALHAIPWPALKTRDGRRIGEAALPILLTGELEPRAALALRGRLPRVLALGDPHYGAQKRRSGSIGRGVLRSAREGEACHPSLPGTKEEILAIQESFPGTTTALFGRAATRSALLRALHDNPPDILHIATHAISHVGAKERSHLVLACEGDDAPSILGFDEASLLDLSGVQLVVLSACSTMHGSARQVEGILALSWAFRAAGASAVISTRWEVVDDAAAYLWGVFYGGLAECATIPEALHSACGKLRADPRFSDPFHWAAYQIVV